MTYFLEHDILDTHRNVGNCSQEYVGVPRARRAVVKEKGEKENRQNGARIRESGLHAMLGALEAEHGLLLAAPLALAACAARADGGSPGAEARSCIKATDGDKAFFREKEKPINVNFFLGIPRIS